MKEIRLKSHGKINLALDVTGKQEDGYHTLATIYQKISLCDTITMSWQQCQREDILISVTTTKPYIPTDERNLAYKAAKLLIDEKGEYLEKGILKIHIEKHIPVSAGLAGGSSNCASVLIGLNRLWKLKLNIRQLCALGEKMGADVPFCVLTESTPYTCALGEGTGAKLKPLKRTLRKYVLLAKPPFGVSTKEVFKGIDQCHIDKHPDIKALKKALFDGNVQVVYENMINVLEEYTLKKYPQVLNLKEKIQNTGNVKKVLMSGSGPTVFGVYDTFEAAKKACESIRKQGYEAYWADMVR